MHRACQAASSVFARARERNADLAARVERQMEPPSILRRRADGPKMWRRRNQQQQESKP
jgi:hypothetical protein